MKTRSPVYKYKVLAFPLRKNLPFTSKYRSPLLSSNRHHSSLSVLHITNPPTLKMARSLSLSTLMLIALALAGNAAAAPTTEIYPEVIPDPGLPSLAELNVTSAQLHTMDYKAAISRREPTPLLEPRFNLNCDGQKCSANNAVACINYIAAIGSRPCYANFDTAHRAIICTSGSARFQIHQLVDGAMSSW
jgi:hypothetical protein